MSESSPSTHSGHDPDSTPAPAVPESPWARIKEHKIIQWALGYLAAALALTHAEELVAHAFGWPDLIGRLLIMLVALGLPLAITLAWYHGHHASRHVSRAEATIIAILLLIGAGFLWLFVQPHETPPVAQVHAATVTQSAPQPSPVPAKPRIAILPFENLSPDPKNAFFTDGLHEEILATLSNDAPGLEVISRTTMMLYRAVPKPVETIARELGATHVLEGSVRREGDEVRLTLQLIDARTDQHLWSQDYDRTLKSALTLQSEVAQTVAGQLAVKLGLRSDSGQTVDPQAYDLYLKARLVWLNLGDPNSDLAADYRRITDLYQQAIGRDPRFGKARVELANRLLRTYLSIGDEPYLTGARDQLASAQTLIPGNLELTLTQAMYNYVMDTGQPLTPAVESAVESTQDPLIGRVGEWLYGQAGRFEDVRALYERLLRLDPGNAALVQGYINSLQDLRRPQVALQALDSFAQSRSPVMEVLRRQWRTCIPFLFSSRVDLESACLASWDSETEFLYGDRSPFTLGRRARSLAYLRNYPAARALIEKAGSTLINWGETTSTGSQPAAEQLGWIALLMNDAAAAHRQSDAIRDFLALTPKTHMFAWYGTALAAEAQLFAGDHAGAIKTAQEVVASRPRERDARTWRSVASLSARILAWAGAQDKAVQLLDNLSTAQGGLRAAEIIRDPLFDAPLAGNPSWQALKARIEAQMAATKLE